MRCVGVGESKRARVPAHLRSGKECTVAAANVVRTQRIDIDTRLGEVRRNPRFFFFVRLLWSRLRRGDWGVVVSVMHIFTIGSQTRRAWLPVFWV